MWKKLEIKTGDKFNRLTIIKEVKPWNWRRPFIVLCDCWKTSKVNLSSLTTNHTKSCWCLELELKTNHWMYWTKMYWVWSSIKNRCNDKNNKYYWWSWITYCDNWNNFEWFYEDMKDSYKEWLSIDRINNNWNYCKDNCRWATAKEQQRNTSFNKIYKWKCISEWCEIFWLNSSTIFNRINKLWRTIEESFKCSGCSFLWFEK